MYIATKLRQEQNKKRLANPLTSSFSVVGMTGSQSYFITFSDSVLYQLEFISGNRIGNGFGRNIQ
jgi:hypothetical protein